MPDTVIREAVGRIVLSHDKKLGAAGPLTISNALRPPTNRAAAPLVGAAFSITGDELVTLDAHGQLVSFHLHLNRYTAVRRQGARAVSIAFSPLRRSELYVALADGNIECIDTATRSVVGLLKGHLNAVHTLACHPHQPMILSCARDAAILWTTADFARLRAMPAAPTRSLQHALFLPSGDGLLTCVERSLTLWRLGDLDAVCTLKLPPAHDASLKLRTCAVTPDAAFAVGAGEGGWLALWSLHTRTLARMILLPDALGAVTQLTAMPLPPPSATASAPVLLTCTDGAIRLVDAAAPAVVAAVTPSANEPKLVRAALDPSLRLLAAIAGDGTVRVHGSHVLSAVAAPVALRSVTAGPLFDAARAAGDKENRTGPASGKRAPRPTPPPTLPLSWQRAIADNAAALPLASGLPADSALLDPRKMNSMLRTCWQFPARQRPYAWRLALRLPRNERAYAALVAKGVHPASARLHTSLPLANRRTLGRLERLLSCLAHWCPLFGQVGELPPTAFPWLLAFDGDELGAFEACATVLLNWGGRFYEYHPNPPIEVLRDADTVLHARNPVLRAHLLTIGAGPASWAWPLLASLFARVLARPDWLMLWDHLVCMAPQFLLFVLVNFVHLHAGLLLRAETSQDVAAVLLRPSALQMRVWLKAAYAQYDATPPEAMPQWAPFTPLEPGEVYPPGLAHPTVIVDHGAKTIEAIRQSELELARQRMLVSAMDEESEAESARLAAWSEREASLAHAEDSARRQLSERKAAIDRQAGEASLALKEQRLKGATMRAERMRLTQDAREREHTNAMTALQVCLTNRSLPGTLSGWHSHGLG